MTTPIQFYVEKAAELGVLPSDLCDIAELVLAADEVVPVTFKNSSVDAWEQWGGISFCQHSKPNPQGLYLLTQIRLVEPNLPAIENAPGRVQDISDVVHKDYWFAMHDNNGSRNNFLEFTVREGCIVSARIDETQLGRAVAVSVPRDLFQTGRDYGKGLSWMLQLYARR